jgi:hypothetical protein
MRRSWQPARCATAAQYRSVERQTDQRAFLMANLHPVFAIEVSGTAVVAFEASSQRQAWELSKEAWFLDELVLLKSNGRPVFTKGSRLKVRSAKPTEVQTYREAEKEAISSDDLLLVYLISLDGLS